MSAISEFLSSHHAHLDRLLAEAIAAAQRSEWPAYRLRIAALGTALLDHISYEDEELFPEFERLGVAAGDLASLRDDHASFRQQIEALSAAAPEHDPEGCIGELELLAAFQRAHHKHELTACYAQADRLTIEPPPPMPAAPAAGVAPLRLDLRGLQPPEPIVRIFEALERTPRAPLCAILPHEPMPLYAPLRERGYAFTGTPRADGGFEVLIEPSRSR
jgi:hypothetical protein